MTELAVQQISGRLASDIAASVRSLIDVGALRPGDALPPVRTLADQLSVNRNTVTAAYRQLATAGTLVTDGRRGTRVATPSPVAQEGFAPDTVLHDVGSGNPDPSFIPDPSDALQRVAHRPVLYGEPVIDADLDAWARTWLAADLAPHTAHLTVTSGASDAVERLLATLSRDDAVAIEDPGFLTTRHTVQVGGFRPLPVPVDREGMTVDGLRAALDAGARAVILTPRAQNPTGVSLTAERAAALREVLAEWPYVMVIEDDHFSMLSTHPVESVIGAEHQRFARIRSVSNFLGPDMCVAITASDADTAEKLARRLTPGTSWVSHLLQRLTHALVTDDETLARIAHAARHYAERNAAFIARLADHGLSSPSVDGLNVWVELPVSARAVSEQLMRRGWLARTGDEFSTASTVASHRLRLTVHHLDDNESANLANDLAAAIRAVGPPPRAAAGTHHTPAGRTTS